MRTALITTALTAAASLPAQGTLATATDYGTFANAGSNNVQGVPAGSAIGTAGLSVVARDGVAGTTNRAAASTQVGIAASRTGAAVRVSESGAASADRSSRAAAGTTDNLRAGGGAAHGLVWSIPGRAGATGVVLVNWEAAATTGASSGAAVDTDGDGAPDFASRISGGRESKQVALRVVAGARGFRIGIATSGHALGAAGSATYDSDLTVAFRPDGGGTPTCTVRPFGPECGGKLDGQAGSAGRGIGIGLNLTGAAPNAVVALVAGGPTTTPVQLPASRCSLLVNPRILVSGSTDARGNASWRFGIPNPGGSFSVAFQAITLQVSTGAVRLASSNGLGVSCN